MSVTIAFFNRRVSKCMFSTLTTPQHTWIGLNLAYLPKNPQLSPIFNHISDIFPGNQILQHIDVSLLTSSVTSRLAVDLSWEEKRRKAQQNRRHRGGGKLLTHISVSLKHVKNVVRLGNIPTQQQQATVPNQKPLLTTGKTGPTDGFHRRVWPTGEELISAAHNKQTRGGFTGPARSWNSYCA